MAEKKATTKKTSKKPAATKKKASDTPKIEYRSFASLLKGKEAGGTRGVKLTMANFRLSATMRGTTILDVPIDEALRDAVKHLGLKLA